MSSSGGEQDVESEIEVVSMRKEECRLPSEQVSAVGSDRRQERKKASQKSIARIGN